MYTKSHRSRAYHQELEIQPAAYIKKSRSEKTRFWGKGRRIRLSSRHRKAEVLISALLRSSVSRGSESPRILDFTRFFARFKPFSSQDRVSRLCLKFFDAFLMLFHFSSFILPATAFLMLFKAQNLRRGKQRKMILKIKKYKNLLPMG